MYFENEILPFFPQVILGTTVLICFLNYQKFPVYFKAFSFYWLIIFLGEVAGHAMGKAGINNLFVYNTTFTLSCLFVPWFIIQFPGSEKLKRFLKWYILVFVALVIIEILKKNYFQDPGTIMLTYPIVIGQLAIIVPCAWYLWQLYKSDEVSSLRSDPHFWLSVGFLAYYAAITPYLAMMNDLNKYYPDFTSVYHLVVTYGFNFVINLSICIAFLCRTLNSAK